MKDLTKIVFFIVCITSVLSCGGKISKSWTVEDFSQTHVFTIDVADNKNVSNANVYMEGKFTGHVILQKDQNSPFIKFSQDSIPSNLFFDFYGGQFDIYLIESDANGELKITIEIPYHP
ncbi:MAG: hypothetical protein ABJ092_02040 [Gillisia sp.]